ncbi:hypothetical protein K4F52_006410 [Lecanicillium sp. MT-2017a]|nr:hypothetical protein K4F52_006410 [Lecanicillium sp. MT-2017a]
MAGWYSERKQQLEASLASTIKNGNMVNNSNPWKILVRDWGLWLLQMIPTMKQWIELGPRMAGRMRYTYEPGMAFLAEMGGGALFSQSFCVRVDHSSDVGKEIFFTDDVIFREGKKSLFQIIVFLDDGMGQRLIYQDAIRSLEYISPRLYPHEATFFVTNNAFTVESKANIASKETYRFASAAEFAASPLSNGRPYPHGYREDDMHTGVNRKKFAIVRSDRFVFASCDTKMELEVAAKRLNELFPM